MSLVSVKSLVQTGTALSILLFSAQALAWHDDYVRRLAYEAEGVSARLQQIAQNEAYENGQDEYTQRALADFYQLSQTASHFRVEVETNCRESAHTEMDFRELNNSFYQAQQSVRYGRFSPDVYEQISCLSRVLQQLSAEYYNPEPIYPPSRVYTYPPVVILPPPPIRRYYPRPFPRQGPEWPMPRWGGPRWHRR